MAPESSGTRERWHPRKGGATEGVRCNRTTGGLEIVGIVDRRQRAGSPPQPSNRLAPLIPRRLRAPPSTPNPRSVLTLPCRRVVHTPAVAGTPSARSAPIAMEWPTCRLLFLFMAPGNRPPPPHWEEELERALRVAQGSSRGAHGNSCGAEAPDGHPDIPREPAIPDVLPRNASERRHAEAGLLRAVRAVLAHRGIAHGNEATTRPGARICPRCGSSCTVRWGRFSGRQRHRCRSCRRTFSDLTGTPLAYSKRLHLWPAFGACMAAGLSVRRTGRRLGIDKDTAFRWRHRLGYAYAEDCYTLSGPGRVAVAQTLMTASEKGIPTAGRRRPHLRRARLTRSYLSTRVVVSFVLWDGLFTWEFSALPIERLFPTAQDLQGMLGAFVPRGSVLIAPDLRSTALGGFARSHGCTMIRAFEGSVPDSGSHLGASSPTPSMESIESLAHRARTACRGWKRWLRRFRGVGSVHLGSYLAWYRQLVMALGRHLEPWEHGILALEGPRFDPGASATEVEGSPVAKHSASSSGPDRESPSAAEGSSLERSAHLTMTAGLTMVLSGLPGIGEVA